jgi:hypothetical protein
LEKNKLKDTCRPYFDKYTKIFSLMQIGDTWLSEFRSWFPIGASARDATLYSAPLWAVHNQINFWIIHLQLPDWINWGTIFIFLLCKFYVMLFVKWLSGKFAIWIGWIEARQHRQSKDKELAPYQVQLQKTLENIANKVGAKSEFTEL